MHPNSGTHDSGGIEILQDCGQFGADEAPWSVMTIISNASCQIPTSKASKQVSGCYQVGEGLKGVRGVHWGPGRGLGVQERHGTGQGRYMSCGSGRRASMQVRAVRSGTRELHKVCGDCAEVHEL